MKVTYDHKVTRKVRKDILDFNKGSAIIFTDNGTGTNAYRHAGLHGSRPSESIGSGSPSDLECEALVQGAPGDEVVILISNKTDAVDILCSEGYARLIGN